MNNRIKLLYTCTLFLFFYLFISFSVYAAEIDAASSNTDDSIRNVYFEEANLPETKDESIKKVSRRSQALEDSADTEVLSASISDPLEPVNRFFFQFNDKLYLFVLKPASNVYKFIIPEEPRICLKNFFNNIVAPVRIVNCLLQGKAEAAGNEFLRFIINTTAGVGGLADPATYINIPNQKEDFGQTLAVYGLDHGFYLNLPVFGPTSLRDGIGQIGDVFLEPVTYMFDSDGATVSATVVKTINNVSVADEYEGLRESAIDPYIAVREAYVAYRKSLSEK